MPAYTNWAHKGLDYCIQNGILNGTSATTIAPNGTTTRAQLVTMLYRQAGSPKVAKSSPFTDVTDSWSVDAVNWAFEKGVVNGTSPTTFSRMMPLRARIWRPSSITTPRMFWIWTCTIPLT